MSDRSDSRGVDSGSDWARDRSGRVDGREGKGGWQRTSIGAKEREGEEREENKW